ncbi:Ig-like domain-containing protein [Cellulomonas sp. Marseille-Q8402]
MRTTTSGSAARRRWAAAALGGLLLGLLAPLAPASAAPADDCASPTRTVTGSASGAALDVAAGEVVLIAAGAQVGGVNTLPAGATLCVAAGATLAPAYVNNAAGTLYVAPGGTATMPSIAVDAGFVLDNAGTATFAGLALNGPGTVTNRAGATLTVTGAFTPAAGTIVNEGTLALPGGATLNSPVSLVNDGTLTASGTTIVNGPFRNAGTATLDGDLVVNGSGTLTNLCVLTATGGLTNNGPGSSSTGLVALGSGFVNQGTWRQAPTAALTATTLSDDGSVTGFGRYVFSGSTSVQGGFDGDTPLVPIFVDVPGTTFPGTGAGSVTNVDVRDLVVPGPADYPAPDCADPVGPAAADVQVSKTGPAFIGPGGVFSYTITVTNAGPDAAAGVTVTDALPPELTGVTASGGGVVAPPAVTWSLGTLAVGDTVTLTVTGTAPDDGELVNSVSATATTPDPDASNNDGTADSETVVTEVTPGTDVVAPPTADDLLRETVVGRPVVSTVTGSSTDPDLQLRFSRLTSPADGALLLLPGGRFAYLPAAGFVGTDSFTYQVCDNQVPQQCSAPATVTLIVHPLAVDDETTTLVDQPVTVDVLANDPDGALLSTDLADLADHGLVSVDPATGTARYTPGPGYLGTDSFTYRACAPADPADCASAVVTVHVVPDNLPPAAPPLALETTVGTPVSGDPAVSDPDGDAVTLTSVFPTAAGGTAGLAGGTLTYTPPPGFAGQGVFQYTVCDDGIPVLCSTGLVTVLVDPVAVDDDATTPAGTPVPIDVVANDQGTVLPPDVTTPPAHGTAELVDGVLVYTPAPGFTGTDTFAYRVCAADVSPACAEAVVTVVVTGAGDPDDGGTGSGGTGGDPGGPTRDGTLPRTGAESGPLAALALGLAAAGAALRAATTRPRRARRTAR